MFATSATFIQLLFTIPAIPSAIVVASAVVITILLSYMISPLESNSNKIIFLTVNFSNILS